MRVLAIRGQNLASLAGAFEVQLDRPPLDVGLYAITGPTGSGKSTILDAMCLALFDRTPRLASSGGVHIGREDEPAALRVRANDVRSILRRGAATGWAEVDFVGRDGLRYRARWAVHRARGRATGRLQHQSISLHCLDTDEQLGGTKTETLVAIEQRLGLSFDQFSRSALLAQGDFAAFLQADTARRADLLERMTGTAIYGDLSQAAHERARTERQRLDELRALEDRLGVLDDQARTGLEARAAELRAERDQAEALLESARSDVAWYEQLDALRSRELDGQQALQVARAEWDAAEAMRREYEQVLEVLHLRAPLQVADNARAELDHARAQLDQAEFGAKECQRHELECAAEYQHHRLERDQARLRLKQLGPDLHRARELDVKLSEASDRLAEAERQARDATDKAAELEEVARSREQQVRYHEQDLASATGWLADHPRWAPLAERWEEAGPLLQRYHRIAVELAELEQAGAALDEAAHQARRLQAEATAARDGARTRLDKCLAQLQAAEGAIPRQARETLRTRRVDADLQRELAEEALECSRQAARSLTTRQQAAERASASRQESVHQRHLAAEAHQLVQQLTGEVLATSRSLEAAEAARSLESRREQLQPGEPCPLCGSVEHPWATGPPALVGLIHDLHAEHDRLRAELDTASKAEAAALARAEAATSSADEHEVVSRDAAAQLPPLRRRWAEVASNLPDLAARVDDAAAVQGAEVALAQARRDLAALHDDDQALEALERAVDDSRMAVEQARGDRNLAEVDLASAADHRADADRAVMEHGSRVQVLQADLELTEGHLAPSFSGFDGWLHELTSAPGSFAERCREGVGEHLALLARRDEASRVLADLRPEARIARGRAGDAAQQAALARAKVALHHTALVEREDQRAEVLDGRRAADVQAELDEALHRAEHATEQAQSSQEAAHAAVAASQALVSAAKQLVADRFQVWSDAHHALTAALAVHDLEEPQLRERLDHDDDWLDERRSALDGLQAAVTQSRSILSELSRQRVDHASTPRPATDEADVTATLAAAKDRATAAREGAVVVAAALHSDDKAREQATELARQIEIQEPITRVWRQLDELIGSHDGRRFRQFAQGLTLDALLALANQHLVELARRYRLTRVPGHDLDLQVVDVDMGDEVRSINSLSGGETFLVSLALALALSSLTATDTPVQSLFVDEGFGSLDRDALDTALAALDALQATGRQIGIISHVQGLADHIGVQIQVVKQGTGRSSLRILSPA